MIRTQIYLPDETHASLLRLARSQGTTLSQLIRQGAVHVVKKHKKKMNKQQEALDFFANYPDHLRVKLSDSAVNLIRQDREET